MGKNRRQSALTKSIQTGVLRDPAQQFHKTAWGRLLAFFSLFKIKLVRHDQELFRTLRREIWQFDENEYQDSFRTSGGQPPLKTMGDLGYSGSTFFGTLDGRYVIKSIPRHFEYTFFQSDLLEPYYDHMRDHPDSMLVWITDYLIAPYSTLGTVLSWTPAHHIIMENILCGKSDDLASNKWETYDLKPLEYFYPERDLVPEPLVSEDTLNRLSDHFEDKLHLSREDYNTFIQAMKTDTKFLEDANAVDYSMFLVRIPASSTPECLGRKSPWRAGIRSADGKWKYRAVILDFFWAKHKLHAQALSGVVQTFNVVGRQGHMSITTTSTDYREKFLAMVEGMIQIH